MPQMSPAAVDAFLRETRIAKLAYLSASGAPTIVPVWFEWDGAAARIFTSRVSPKVRRIDADARVALSVEEPVGVQERWVTIEGAASLDAEGTSELLKRLARRYYAPPKAEQTITEWLADPSAWVTVTVTPSRIRSEG